MAVTALSSDALLVTTSTSTVTSNTTSTASTDVAFALPAETPSQPVMTENEDEHEQNTPDDLTQLNSNDSSSDVSTTTTEVTTTPPALEHDLMLSQQLTPLQLALGQTFAESSDTTPAFAVPAESTGDDGMPPADLNTEIEADTEVEIEADIDTDTSSATAATPPISSANTAIASLMDSAEKLNSTEKNREKNTTEQVTDDSTATLLANDTTQSLNIGLLTLPVMLSTNASVITTPTDTGYATLSVSAATSSGNTAAATDFSSQLTTAATSNTIMLAAKLTPDAYIRESNTTTSQSLTQILSELTQFTASASISTAQNTLLPSSSASTASVTQQLGEQLLDTLKQQVSTQLSQKTQQATIRLDPPSLGQLNISIQIDGDKMTVQINAEHSGVRESLQNSRDQLRQLLSTEHSGSVEVDIGQQQSSTPQQGQSRYVLATDAEMISAAAITDDATATSASSESATTGDWLNTVV